MRRFVFFLLLFTSPFSAVAQPANGTLIPTIRAPAGIRDGSWNTVLLDDGSVLGVGNSSIAGSTSKAFRYAFTTNSWSETEQLPFGIVGLTPTKLPNGKVMALGVTASQKPTAVLFDPSTMSWSTAGELPADNIRFDRRSLGLSNGNVMVLGLSDKKRGGWIYDYQTNSWTLAQALPFEVSEFAHAMNLRDGSALVIAKDRSLEGAWVGLLYDPRSDTWTPTGPLPNGMGGSPTGFTTLRDGTVFFVGYQHSPFVAVAAVLYHPDNKTWTQGGKVPNEFSTVRATWQLPSGSVIASAEESMGNGIYSPLFNPVTNSWKVGPKLPGEYKGLAIFGVSTDGVVWGMGYRTPSGVDQLVYSTSLNRWTKGIAMPEGFVNMGRTGKLDGSMFIHTRASLGVEMKTNIFLFVP